MCNGGPPPTESIRCNGGPPPTESIVMQRRTTTNRIHLMQRGTTTYGVHRDATADRHQQSPSDATGDHHLRSPFVQRRTATYGVHRVQRRTATNGVHRDATADRHLRSHSDACATLDSVRAGRRQQSPYGARNFVWCREAVNRRKYRRLHSRRVTPPQKQQRVQRWSYAFSFFAFPPRGARKCLDGSTNILVPKRPEG